MITEFEAVFSLVPDARFGMRNGVIIGWENKDVTQPTGEEIQAEVNRLQAVYDSEEWKRNRQLAYPSTKDFMEAYTEKEIGGNSTKWDAYVINYNKTRSDNPK
jgi:hypothetical protein